MKIKDSLYVSVTYMLHRLDELKSLMKLDEWSLWT